MQKVQFEYFYNDDSDQYSFYRIPKLLFTEEYFSSLSCESKVLYVHLKMVHMRLFPDIDAVERANWQVWITCLS